ncbi:MAG: hypothetical protein AB7S71_12105 [Dongiaceae bacterium]
MTPRLTIRILWIVFAVMLAATVAVEWFVHPYGFFVVDGTFAFNAWYGFAACVALIVVAKLLGIVIKRPDDYYDR